MSMRRDQRQWHRVGLTVCVPKVFKYLLFLGLIIWMAYKRKFSRYSKKSRRGKFTRKYRKGAFASRVKKVIAKTQETKFLDYGELNIQLYHNSGAGVAVGGAYNGFMYDPWSTILQGNGRAQRVGDQVQPRGMSLKLWLANKLDRPNVMYRILVVSVRRVVGGNVVTASNLNPFNAVMSHGILCPVDMELVTRVYYDRVFNLQVGYSHGGASDREAHKYIKIWLRRRRGGKHIKYGSDGKIANNGLLVYCIPYDSYGTLMTDNIASMSFAYRLYWKDG